MQVAGHLTNAFGQSLSLSALALVALGSVGRGVTRGVALTTAVALAASLSHISTFAILVLVLLAIAAGLTWRGHAHVRASAVGVAAVAAVVAALAVVVYYGHFLETYRSQIARLLGEMGYAAAGSGPGSHSVVGRLASVPHDLRVSFGIPVIVLAAAGATWVWRRRQLDRLALTLGGWAVGCAAFLVLGVLTPVNVRYDLAFFPAMAMLSGIGASWLWRAGPLARAVSVGLLAWVVGLGVWQWLLPLTDWPR